MKIKNKFLIKAIIEPIDSGLCDYYKKYGIEWREFKRYLKIYLNNLLFSIYEKHPFLEWFLCSLCEAEMQLKAVFDKEFRHYLDTADVCVCQGGELTKSQAILDIPEQSLYCGGCPFKDRSDIADLLFGEQSSGYCYYLGKGDFSFIRPTDLLWDGCKECGINEDLEESKEE